MPGPFPTMVGDFWNVCLLPIRTVWYIVNYRSLSFLPTPLPNHYLPHIAPFPGHHLHYIAPLPMRNLNLGPLCSLHHRLASLPGCHLHNVAPLPISAPSPFPICSTNPSLTPLPGHSCHLLPLPEPSLSHLAGPELVQRDVGPATPQPAALPGPHDALQKSSMTFIQWL